MSNVIGINEFLGSAGKEAYCWLCQKPVSARAMFCHGCGSIQPVRDVDHFTRLGLEMSLDVDMEKLEKQYASLCAQLSPERFLIRGVGERGHAAKQMEVLKAAYQTLREPLRRGRYWLQLNAKEVFEDADGNPLVIELRQELTNAADPCHCDRVAQKAGQALEHGVMLLMQALRGEDWCQASRTLSQIDGVETILNDARVRRAGMTVT